jgi:hypothetical protein
MANYFSVWPDKKIITEKQIKTAKESIKRRTTLAKWIAERLQEELRR